MQVEQWTSRFGWLAMAVGILITGRLAHAQPEATDVETTLLSESPEPALKDRPWLGLHCFPADATLRAHVKLPAGQGLVVGSVAPDSPAAKAGIQSNDILLKAGDQALKEVADLISAIEQSTNKPLQLELVRAGETKTLEVTPGTRNPAGAVVNEPQFSDRGVVDRFLERMPRVVEGLPERIRLLRAGPPVAAAFPKDLTLNITKQGDTPAKVVVSRGEEKWETTEDKLDALPEGVRGPVEVFLGKTTDYSLNYTPTADEPAAARTRELEGRVRRQVEEAERRAAAIERRLRDEAGPQGERVGERIEQIERQLQQRLEKLDRLIDEKTRALREPPAAKPATPAPAATPIQPEAGGPELSVPEAT